MFERLNKISKINKYIIFLEFICIMAIYIILIIFYIKFSKNLIKFDVNNKLNYHKMKINSNFSPNFSKKTRSKKNIKFIIIHYTGMQSEIESIKRLKNIKFKVSCHYLINRTREVFSNG